MNKLNQRIKDLGNYPSFLRSGNMINKHMKTQVSYLLTTGRVVKDEYKGGLYSYIDIFESILIPKNQNFWIQSFVVAGKIYTSKNGLLNIEVSILDPENIEFKTNKLSGTFVVGDIEVTTAFNLMKFEKLGRYLIKIKVDGELLEDNDKFYLEVVKEK